MSTGARVGGVRPPGIPRESWLRRKTIKSEAARRVREVTDNRTTDVEYRIEYQIQRSIDGGEFEEIGFGSSGGWGDIDQAVHMASSAVHTPDARQARCVTTGAGALRHAKW